MDVLREIAFDDLEAICNETRTPWSEEINLPDDYTELKNYCSSQVMSNRILVEEKQQLSGEIESLERKMKSLSQKYEKLMVTNRELEEKVHTLKAVNEPSETTKEFCAKMALTFGPFYQEMRGVFERAAKA